MTAGPQDEPEEIDKRYALRISPRARLDIDQARQRLEELVGGDLADDWEEGIEEAISRIAALPLRHGIADERRYFAVEVRQLLYRRRPGGPAHRVFFTVQEGDDGPVVTILHVRHGARGPMTAPEARQIESEAQDG